MRQPTPRVALYSWHAAALFGRAIMVNDQPHPGWFKCRLVKGGVMVPARVWMFQDVCPATGELLSDEILQAEVNGEFADPEAVWSRICDNPITEKEFRYLTARLQHAARHEPDDAFADPRRPVDLLTQPLPF